MVQGAQETMQETLRWNRVIAETLLLAILALLAQQADAGQRSRVDEAATLAARSCEAVTREALSGDDLDELAYESGTAAEVWIAGEFVPDVRVTIWEDSEVRAEVAATEADAGRACAQLRRIYEARPAITPEEASKRIKTRLKRYSERTHPDLRPLFEDLRDLRISTDLSDSLFLPNRSVVLRISNGYEEVRVAFNQPEPSAEGVAYSGDLTVSQPEASRWVDRLIHSLGILKAR